MAKLANNGNVRSMAEALLETVQSMKRVQRRLARLADVIDEHSLTDQQITDKLNEVDGNSVPLFDVADTNDKFNTAKGIFINTEIVDKTNNPPEPEPQP